MTGSTHGPLDGNSNTSEPDLFVVKYDTNGSILWIRQLSGTSHMTGFAVVTDSSGNAFIAGETTNSQFGNEKATYPDSLLIMYDSSGTRQWATHLEGSDNETVYCISTDTNGNVYLGGRVLGSMDGNPSAGSSDAFVVKYYGGAD